MATFTLRSQTGARFSTRFYSESATGSFTELDDDLSQYLTNLTSGTSNVSEAATTRFNYMPSNGRRTLRFQIRVDTGSTGVLFRHGTTNVERLEITGSTVDVTVNNSSVISQAFSTVIDGTIDTVILLWQTIPNPDTTGASDAMLSFMVLRDSAGAVERASFTHAAKTLESDTAVFGADDTGDTNAYTDEIRKIGYDNDYTSLTQAVEDWISSSSAPSTDLLLEREWHPFAEAGAGEEGEFYGPSVAWCSRAHRQVRRRTFSPLINENYDDPFEFRNSRLASNDKMADAPTGDNYRVFMPLTWRRPVPELCNVFWVRIHLLTYVTSGGAVPIGIRMLSLDSWPGSGHVTDFRFVQEIVLRDDTASGDGQWNLNGYAPIVRDSDGWSYFALAFDVDPNNISGNDGNARWFVSSVVVVPRVLEDAAGGAPPFGGGDAGD